MNNQTVLNYSQKLKDLKIEHSLIEHPVLTEVADVMNFIGKPISESSATLVMKADNNYFAIIRRGDTELNVEKTKQLLGVNSLQIASPSEFTQITGLQPGEAHYLVGLKTFIDQKVLEKEFIYGGSGSNEVTIKYKTSDLRKIPNSQVVDIAVIKSKPRILTGDRPTGPLHLGHYVGTLKNRVALQDQYDCFFVIADLHTLTTNFTKERTSTLNDRVRGLVLDYLSVGIDPKKSVIYQQSQVPEVTYLSVIFEMLVTTPRAERVPTLKDVMRASHIEHPSVGLLAYPIIQAADILMVKGNLVPVGKDQSSHVELTREIARDFNKIYGEVFPVPKALIGEVGTLPGTDGQAKMGKSIGNCIYLSDDEATVTKKVMSMYTDPTRLRPTDPGHVEGNPVFIYHDAFNDNQAEIADLKDRYVKGQVGDVEVKTKLALAINKFLTPIRAKRAEYEGKDDLINQIIESGSAKARLEAQKTLDEVLVAMGIK